MTNSIEQNAQILAEYTRKLEGKGEFERVHPSRHTRISSALIDAALQGGMRYTTVLGRVQKFEENNPSVKTVQQFKELVDGKPLGEIQDIIDWRHDLKVQSLADIVHLLSAEKVDTLEDLYLWVKRDGSREKLQGVKGVKNKIPDYLSILSGDKHSVAVDRRICEFLKSAGITASCYEEKRDIVKRAAELLDMNATDYDASIWCHMEGDEDEE